MNAKEKFVSDYMQADAEFGILVLKFKQLEVTREEFIELAEASWDRATDAFEHGKKLLLQDNGKLDNIRLRE